MKRIFSTHYTVLALAAGLCLTGCKTVQETPAPPPTGAQVTAMGQAFMRDPTPARLLQWASTWHDKNAAAVTPVLNEWFDLEQVLAGERFKAGKLEDAYFHLGNVRQGRGLPADTWKAFLLDYIAKHEATGKWATAKYMRQEIEGSPSQDLYEPMDVADYFKYLVDVYLESKYWDIPAQLPRTTWHSGTGFLVGPRHVLTAFHVVKDGMWSNVTKYEVQVRMGERFITNGRILAWDNISDVALIELPESLDAPKDSWKLFGNSRRLRRGFEVYALGNPKGLTASLTRGIISSLSRRGTEGENWIQFDAAIAPGSSGGILVGKDGLIYGLLVAGNTGAALNFAVPSQTVLKNLDGFLGGKVAAPGFIGVLLERTLLKPEVVTISHILPLSPLKALPVRPGARLLRLNQVPIRTISEVYRQMDLVVPGQVLSLEVSNTTRDPSLTNTNQAPEKSRTVWIQAGRKPNSPLFWATDPKQKFETMYLHFGLELSPAPVVTSAIANFLLKTQYPNYHMVLRVAPDGYMEHQGVVPGDAMVILQDSFYQDGRLLELVHLPLAKNPSRSNVQPIRQFEALHYKVTRSAGDDDAL